MHINNRTVLKFEVVFTIPINNTFNKITITDPLADGLRTYDGPGFATYDFSTIYLDDSDIPITSGVTHKSTNTVVSLELDSSIATSPNSIRKVKALIPVVVYNADELFSAIDAGIPDPNNPGQTLPLENIATITALDINNEILTTSLASSPLEFESCSLTAFGGASTVEKIGGKTAYLLASITGIDSFGTNDLQYKMTITTHPELDISEVYSSNATLTVGGYTYTFNDDSDIDENHPLYDLNFNVDNNLYLEGAGYPEIDVSFLHKDIMKSSEIYISIPVITKNTIYSISANFILNDSIVGIHDTSNDGDLLCAAPTFDIRINLTSSIPKISDAVKLII